MSFQFKVYSELYGTTDCCVLDIERAIKIGSAPCGDGNDYTFTRHELDQLKNSVPEAEFVPSSSLNYPLNLVALMPHTGNVFSLPTNFRFNLKQYADVKAVMLKSGGRYHKNSFIFDEPAELVYDRIINGEDYNLKKKFQFFGTPGKLADRLVSLACIKPNQNILEPSAGKGAIVHAIHRILPDANVYCCELMDINRTELDKIPGVNFMCADFMGMQVISLLKYDRIIANPPFSKNQDIDHITQMYKFLEKGGRLVSIASKHWQHSSNKKETDFRNWLVSVGAQVLQVDAGEFKESGTSIATVIIVIDKQ